MRTAILISSFALTLSLSGLAFAEDALSSRYYDEGVKAMQAEKYSEGERILKLALQEASATHPNRGNILNVLGQAYLYQERYKEAEPLLLEAISYQRKANPIDEPILGSLLNNVTIMYMDQKRSRDAEPLLVELLGLMDKQPASQRDARLYADVQHRLGSVYIRTGRPKEGKKYFEAALPVLEKLLGKDHQQVQACRHNLELLNDETRFVVTEDSKIEENLNKGTQAFASGRKEEAEAYFKASLDESVQINGKDHYNTKVLMERIAEAKAIDNAKTYMNQLDPQIRRWNTESGPILVYIEPGEGKPGYQPQYTELVKKAILTWQDALKGKIRFEFTDNPKLTDMKVIWLDKQPTVKGLEGDDATLGQNVMIVSNNTIIRNDIELFLNGSAGKQVDAEDLYSTLLHEVGHSLGISGHSTNPTDIMFSYTQNGWKRLLMLSPRDIATVEALYLTKLSVTNPKGFHLSKIENK